MFSDAESFLCNKKMQLISSQGSGNTIIRNILFDSRQYLHVSKFKIYDMHPGTI